MTRIKQSKLAEIKVVINNRTICINTSAWKLNINLGNYESKRKLKIYISSGWKDDSAVKNR